MAYEFPARGTSLDLLRRLEVLSVVVGDRGLNLAVDSADALALPLRVPGRA
jgi:hypothetical protein